MFLPGLIGQSEYQAYQNIATEVNAYENGVKIDEFFNNAQNRSDFMSILSDGGSSDSKKVNRLEALGLERIKLPGLNSLKSSLSTRLTELSSDDGTNAASPALLQAVQTLLEMINKQIKDTKEEIEKSRK